VEDVVEGEADVVDEAGVAVEVAEAAVASSDPSTMRG
jgi:hypothetical protein